MAIEHFDEKIVPEIKKNRPEASQISFYDMMLTSPRCTAFEGFHAFNLSRTQSDTSLTTNPSPMKEERVAVSRKSKLSSVISLYKKQSKIIKAQSRQISKMFTNLKGLKRRLDDTEIKNRELTESIKQLKEVGKMEIDNVEPVPKKKRSATMVIKRHLT
jgi:membrane-associated HD superfamily phosphohydrolase